MKRGVPFGMVYRRKVVSTDASNVGWGALCDGKPAVSLWSKKEGRLHINCLEMLSVCLGLVRSQGTPRLSPIGQHDGGVLYKLPGHSSRVPLEMGSAQLEFAESYACAESRHAISEQCPLVRVDAPPTNGSGNLGDLQQTRGQCLHLRRQLSTLDWPNLFLYAFLPIALIQQVIRTNQGTEAQSSISGPTLEEPALVCRAVSAALCSPVANPLRRDLLSQANRTIWQPQPELWALHLWPLERSLKTFPRVY